MTRNRIIAAVWQKASTFPNYDPDLYRFDAYGKIIAFCEYGKTTQFGWEIDHIFPKSLGENNDISNLQPLHWKVNRIKGDRLPY